MKKKTKKGVNYLNISIGTICIITLLITVVITIFTNVTKSEKRSNVIVPNQLDYNYASININAPGQERQKMKVLVIEINPLLNSITDTSRYRNNGGHPKASEYLGFQTVAPDEMEEDIEYASHGYIDVEITKTEWLNDFPKYTNNDVKIKSTGEYKNKLDEETFLDMFASDENINVGDYFKGINSEVFNEIKDRYDFDYEYIIEKYDLINRRNNGEFDQVWLNAIDPSNCYETIMIGKNAYWINGTPIEKNCKNFIMLYINIARRDSCLHSLGHASENIMSYAFEGNWNEYKKDAVEASDVTKLNLWRRFTLNNWNSSSGNNGVGDVHFPFNGTVDYDYENTNKVYTSWTDWKNNYPNLTGEKQLDNCDAWLKNPDNLALGDNECKDSDRLYMRFWFSLFPHIEGYYDDGHLNNWWKYIYSCDYIKEIKNNDDLNKKIKNNEKINIDLNLIYHSGEVQNITEVEQGNNIKIQDESIVEYKDGILYAKKTGNTDIKLSYDGKSITYKLEVEKDPEQEQKLIVDPNGGKWKNSSNKGEIVQRIGTSVDLGIPVAPKGYEILFNTNGGNEIPKITSTKKFDKWTLQEGAEGTLTGTIYTFEEGNDTVTANYKDIGITLPNATKNGYKFYGWYTNSNLTNRAGKDDSEYVVNKKTTLYAKWEPITYTITYNLDGGNVEGNPIEYTIETNNITLNNPIKDGYKFKGWTEGNEQDSKLVTVIKKGSTGNKKFTANWIIENKNENEDINETNNKNETENKNETNNKNETDNKNEMKNKSETDNKNKTNNKNEIENINRNTKKDDSQQQKNRVIKDEVQIKANVDKNQIEEKGNLPKTGKKNVFIISFPIVILFATIMYRKYKKYKSL